MQAFGRPRTRIRISSSSVTERRDWDSPGSVPYHREWGSSEKRPLTMLLRMSSGVFGPGEVVVDLSCDVAFEAADGFFLGESIAESPVDVVACSLV